jgi:hypothetical protein
VEGAVGYRAVTEKRHRHRAVASQQGCRRGSHRDRQAGRDDAVGAEDPDRRIGDVHRARAPAVRALVLGHELGEHPGRVETFREAVAVATMGRGDHVVRAEWPARADGRRLLSDREVHEPRYLTVAVQRCDAFLEPSDHEHPPMHLEEVGVAEHETCIVLTGTNAGRADEGARCPSRSTSPRRSLVPATSPVSAW